MNDTVDDAREALERVEEHAHPEPRHNPFSVRVAIMISMLAALLAIVELGEKSEQNEYLTHHVTLSDDFAYYQAKTIRSNLMAVTAETLQVLPNASDPALQQRITALKAEQARLDDDPKSNEGRKQLLARSAHQTEVRDAAFHRYHGLELATGVLQIAIVLASVSVVTRFGVMAIAAGVLGVGAVAFAALVYFAGVTV